MAYADKRDGKPTGSFVGEWPAGKKKRRFKLMKDAQNYEVFCKLMGCEPPTIEDGVTNRDGPTFAEVAEACKAAGGPKGKWKAERDCSVIQRVDYCVSVVGSYPIMHCHDNAQEMADKIFASLDRAKAPGKGQHRLTNATKNRYVNSGFGAVLTYARKKKHIPSRPELELLDEKTTRKHRDPLPFGSDEVILRLMRDAGRHVEAICVEALIELGFRSGELLRKIRPEQITVQEVTNAQGVTVSTGVLELTKAQTKNSTSRMVILSADIARQIKALIAADKMPTKDQLLNHFKDAVKRAGITGNIVIHSLRHTRVTRMRKAGIDESIRMKLLGHTGKDVHHDYDHVDLEDQLEVAQKLQDYAGKRSNSGNIVALADRKNVA
jgi:integrase